MAATAVDAGARALGPVPAGAVHLAPPGRIGHGGGRPGIGRQQAGKDEAPARLLGHADVAGGLHEGREGVVADGAAVDMEGGQRHLAGRPFAIGRFAFVAVTAHAEDAGRDQRHAAQAHRARR